MHVKAIPWAAGVTAAMLVTGLAVAPASEAGTEPAFADWQAVTNSDAAGPLDLPTMAGEQLVTPPLRGDGVVTSSGPVTFTRSAQPTPDQISRTALDDGASPRPSAAKTGTSSSPDTGTQWCYYRWTSWDAAPAPPAQGDSWGLARANGNGSSWTMAFESHGGLDSRTDTSTAYTSHNLPIIIPAGWPQPSRLIGVVNPSFKGQQFVDSNRSIFGDVSSASNREKIQFGWLYNGYHYWDTLWNIYHESHNAIDYTYEHSWPGNRRDGEFAYIDAFPTRNYTFKFRVDAKVTTSTEFSAPARSQLDWGSQGIDAPALGPNNNVRQDWRVPWALIGYEVPDGWSVTC